MIKAEFTYGSGNTVKEVVPYYSNRDPKDGLIQLASRLEHFGNRYEMFEAEGCKVLLQISGRAVHGQCKKQ